jgi:NAD(P)H-dependent FMN reductase
MPAAAVYFRDPDGHLLEFIAMLDGDARPDAGVVTWSEWIGRLAPSTPDTAESIRVLAICGSLREGSSNRAVVDAAILLAPAGTRMRVFNGLDAIPPFNPDVDVDPAPMGVARFRDALKASDAVLISSPEYAHGVSGVMKNALDWVVGSGELVDKPVALVNATSRATIAHTSLRETLVTMSARMVDEASVTVPLDGKRLDGAAIARDVRLSGLLRSAIHALTGPVRAGRPSDRAPARP